MRCVFVFHLLLFHICLGMKEEYTSLISENLIHEIEKKLAKLDEEDGNSCHFSTVSDTIIKTRDSIAAGADFLKSPTTNTAEECQDECCNTESCNLAVFKEKDDHACYLFDCGQPSVCNFTTHPGFASMSLIGGPHPQIKTETSPPEKHADDLQKLAKGDTSPPTTTKSTTTVPPTTTTPVPTTTTTEKVPVPLYGECQEHKDCAGSRTECLAGYCLCQAGFHVQEGACKPRKQQKPADTDEDLQGKIDGKPDIESNTQNVPPKISYGKDGLRAPDDETDTKEDSNVPQSSEAENQDKPDDKEDGKKIVTESVKSSKTTTTTMASSTSEIDKNNPPDKTVDDDASSNVKVEAAVGDSGVNAEEKTFSVNPSNKGAVIALALGLAVTAMLLVFVGCRLRNVKRRLRRGRPLNSNEADYLINGMYL